MSVKRVAALLLCLLMLVGLLPECAAPARAEGEGWRNLPYWIGVDTVNQRTTIYSTADNSVVHCWVCSTGAGSRQTPIGVFYLPPAHGSERKEWFAFPGAYVKYAVAYAKGLYFHSTLYTKSDYKSMQSSIDKLGHKASHGCIRLPTSAAKWVCHNCPTGTRAIMHKGVDDPLIVGALGHPASTTRTKLNLEPDGTDIVELGLDGTATIDINQPLQLHATVTPQTDKTILTWTSSHYKIATVDDNGLVTPLAKGTTTISVNTNGGARASVTLNIVDLYAPTAVALNYKGTVVLNKGDPLPLVATMTPANALSPLSWFSSRSKYVSVDGNGVVTALKEGKATITVRTRNKKKATVKIQVVDPWKPTGVSLNYTGTVTLHVGETLRLQAGLAPSTARTELTWKTSSARRASVDGSGLVTALKPGKVTITVKTANGKKARVSIKIVE